MNSNEFDVIILGCGPGGSSAATFLAQAGRRVLVLEKEVFPRFHIGESLLPANHAIFREMGVLPALQQAGFLRKLGAHFELGNGSVGTRFVFSKGRFHREPEALHVQPRNHFDLPSAVVAVLAGEVEGSWALKWRVEYFFWLVRIQSRWPLVPRVSFGA